MSTLSNVFKSKLRLGSIKYDVGKVMKIIASQCNQHMSNYDKHNPMKNNASHEDEVYTLFGNLSKNKQFSDHFWNKFDKDNQMIQIIQKWIHWLQQSCFKDYIPNDQLQMSVNNLQFKIYKNFTNQLYLDNWLICKQPKQISTHMHHGNKILDIFIQSVEDTIYSLFSTEQKQPIESYNSVSKPSTSYDFDSLDNLDNDDYNNNNNHNDTNNYNDNNNNVNTHNINYIDNNKQEKEDESFQKYTNYNDLLSEMKIGGDDSDIERASNSNVNMKNSKIYKNNNGLGTVIRLSKSKRAQTKSKTKKRKKPKKSKTKRKNYDGYDSDPLSLGSDSDY